VRRRFLQVGSWHKAPVRCDAAIRPELPIIWELNSGAITGYHAFPVVDPVWQVQP
jgi:hypothetical protein